jgi:putative ABC transport system substrate-binding protein
VNGRNVQINVRGSAGGVDRLLRLMEDLLDLRPNLIVTITAPATIAAKQRTTSIPVLFIGLGDPTDAGLLTNIARPEANITGFAFYPRTIAGKWLGLLKEAAPRIEQVALLLFSPAAPPTASAFFTAAEAAASILGVRAIRTPVRNVAELQNAIEALAAGPYCGLVVGPPPMPPDLRQSVMALATKYRMPAIYFSKLSHEEGLMSYGVDALDPFRHGGPQYADRILRGEKVNNLPVQFPTKYELVLNRRTAKAIGLKFPVTLLALADEVIE